MTADYFWREVTTVPANKRLVGFSQTKLGYDELGFSGDTQYLTDFELFFVDEVLPGGLIPPP